MPLVKSLDELNDGIRAAENDVMPRRIHDPDPDLG